MQLSEFDYALPEALIAQTPPMCRGASRLLDATGVPLVDRAFDALPELLNPGDLLLFNDTRVIQARLMGHKQTGGRVEALVERVLGTHEALVFIRASKAPSPGTLLYFADQWPAVVLSRDDALYHLRFQTEATVLEILTQAGKLPLPPYIHHVPTADDALRYQTVFARVDGAVAAPTAGLHMTQVLLEKLMAAGVQHAFVTLHVGAGTFLPVRGEQLADHRMHAERYCIPAATAQAMMETRAQGGRVIAVGTTVLRAVEAAAESDPLATDWRETRLFITPGYPFRMIDGLITNFHLPKSTLLILVSAFAGVQRIRDIYAHAIAAQYRFFSYGDAMFLLRHPHISAPFD